MEVAMEKDQQVALLQDLETHPAWKLYLAHLERQCKIKDREKSLALRSNDGFKAMKAQFESDGLIQAMGSIPKLLAELNPSE